MTGQADTDPGAGAAVRSGKVIDDIEILRGVAICMVMVGHLPYNLLWWDSLLTRFTLHHWQGAVGVDLFFAISGFVIARSLLPQMALARKMGSMPGVLGAFWLRRMFRLFPAAWLWLPIPLALNYRYDFLGTFGDLHKNLTLSLQAFLNVANIGMAYSIPTSGTARVYWSLSLEEQFYLILPVLVILVRPKLAWVTGAIIAYQFFMPDTPLADMTRPGALATGVLLALASWRPWYDQVAPTVLQNSATLRFLVTGLIVALLGRLATNHVAVNIGLECCLAGFLVFAASYDRSSIWPDKRTALILKWFGNRSYALYLVHLTSYAAVKMVVVKQFGFAPPHHIWLDTVAILSAVLLSLLLAEATHRFVEVPFRLYGRRVTRGFGFRPAGYLASGNPTT